MLHGVIGVGICGHLVKLYKPNESNYLFDGASLVLYMIAVVLYGTSILKGICVPSASWHGCLTGTRIEEYQCW
jgi:predicted membrane channel-forming protein YqfA (hemolysin III family)